MSRSFVQKSDSERLAVIESMVTALVKRLLGNGQPGEIEQLATRIDGHGKRLSSLENWRGWVIGLVVGAAVASGFGLSRLLETIAR